MRGRKRNDAVDRSALVDRFCEAVCDWRALALLELVLCVVIIEFVPYTEIDWIAYMQEVGGVMGGQYDYSQLRGDTGPLVYPAGFVYVFELLFTLTDSGANVRRAQYVFAAMYVIFIVLVWRVYQQSGVRDRAGLGPRGNLVLMLTLVASRRIHSIFVLRLFNDGIAMLLAYGALLLLLRARWWAGLLLYSLAVSIKMNVLLFSVAILAAMLERDDLGGAWRRGGALAASRVLLRVAAQLVLCCLLPQLLLAAPFLAAAPWQYAKGAFDLSRVFFYRWTVNWRIVSEELFLSRPFHVALLAAHVAVMCYVLVLYHRRPRRHKRRAAGTLDVFPAFAANFIGVCFARSLHYQFYVWYYHQLMLLQLHCGVGLLRAVVACALLEVSYNIFPATWWSSALLQTVHFSVLVEIVRFVRRRDDSPATVKRAKKVP